MNVNIKPINTSNIFELEAYIKWENDLEFYHLIAPMRSKDAKVELVTIDGITKFFEENSDRTKNTYIVWDGIKPIGQISIQIDPPHLYSKYKDTCWLGLAIGEKEYWGTGAASQAMILLEETVTKKGLKRIELGVFEFNTRAQKFYQKLGYKVIGKIKDFTYWNNKFWSDIRMEKFLD